MKTRILLLVGLLLAGCSPKITTNLAETRAPLAEDALIVVLGLDDVVPAEAEYLGKIKIGDSGLTKTGEGTLEKVLALAKEQARLAGANVVKLTDSKAPDVWSSVNRIEANIFYMSDISAFDPGPDHVINPEHPDYAIVYFYRSSFEGPLVTYDVYVGETKVFASKVGAKAQVKVFDPGVIEIWAKTESKSSVSIEVEAGGEYYVRCGVSVGFFVGHPSFDLVPASVGNIEYKSLEIN